MDHRRDGPPADPEFTLDDIPQMPEEPDVWYTEEERTADRIFYDREKLKAYIKSQYRFYEYGIWAVIRKVDGVIVGKAGLTNPEESVQKTSENTKMQEEGEQEYLELGPIRSFVPIAVWAMPKKFAVRSCVMPKRSLTAPYASGWQQKIQRPFGCLKNWGWSTPNSTFRVNANLAT